MSRLSPDPDKSERSASSTSEECGMSESVGHILATSPPIAEAILSSLRIKELNTCAQVCKLWSIIASKLKRNRTEISWCFQLAVPFPEIQEGDEHIEVTDDTASYCSSSTDDVGWHYYDVVDSFSCEPSVAVVFVTERLSFKPQRYFMDYEVVHHRKRKKSRKTTAPEVPSFPHYTSFLMKHLAESLPKSCFGLFCSAPGLIGTPVDHKPPIEAEHTEGLCGLFLPKIPGVQYYPFSIMQSDVSHWKRSKQASKEFSILSAIQEVISIPEGVVVKSVILLVHDLFKRKSPLANVMDYFLKNNPQVALAGSVLDELSAWRKTDCHDDDDYEVCVGLAFAGDNVVCSSIILDPYIRGEEAVEQKLLELKNCNLPLKNAICLMFACCGRGAIFHGKNNVEADIFHKLFPTVPLFGVFGNGEVGRNCLFKYKQKNTFGIAEKERLKYEFSTIFLMVSFLNKE